MNSSKDVKEVYFRLKDLIPNPNLDTEESKH